MFALRQVGENRERTTEIGKWYEFVGFVSHKKEFDIAYKVTFQEDEVPERPDLEKGVFGFLLTPGGSYAPLYSNDVNYIMSANGQTLERLNSK